MGGIIYLFLDISTKDYTAKSQVGNHSNTHDDKGQTVKQSLKKRRVEDI